MRLLVNIVMVCVAVLLFFFAVAYAVNGGSVGNFCFPTWDKFVGSLSSFTSVTSAQDLFSQYNRALDEAKGFAHDTIAVHWGANLWEATLSFLQDFANYFITFWKAIFLLIASVFAYVGVPFEFFGKLLTIDSLFTCPVEEQAPSLIGYVSSILG